jgi:hypothetical protein
MAHLEKKSPYQHYKIIRSHAFCVTFSWKRSIESMDSHHCGIARDARLPLHPGLLCGLNDIQGRAIWQIQSIVGNEPTRSPHCRIVSCVLW